jgi:hypothetical protein
MGQADIDAAVVKVMIGSRRVQSRLFCADGVLAISTPLLRAS